MVDAGAASIAVTAIDRTRAGRNSARRRLKLSVFETTIVARIRLASGRHLERA